MFLVDDMLMCGLFYVFVLSFVGGLVRVFRYLSCVAYSRVCCIRHLVRS